MRVALVIAALALGPPLAQQPSEVQANKQLVNDFFNDRGDRRERAMRFMSDAYTQHNPRFLKMDTYTGKHGWEAWVAAQEEGQKRGNLQLVPGGIPLRDPIILIGENDLAVAVYRGMLPDPGDSSQRYDAFAFEAFRFANGKLTEHWDQVRLAPGWMTPRPPNPNAGRGAGRGNNANANRPAVQPEPAAGCAAGPATVAVNEQLVDSIQRARRKGLTRELVVAECDYVALVWKQTLPDPDDAQRTWDAFSFDVYQVHDGRIVAQWDESTR